MNDNQKKRPSDKQVYVHSLLVIGASQCQVDGDKFGHMHNARRCSNISNEYTNLQTVIDNVLELVEIW